jgi:hypothetical protein
MDNCKSPTRQYAPMVMSHRDIIATQIIGLLNIIFSGSADYGINIVVAILVKNYYQCGIF